MEQINKIVPLESRLTLVFPPRDNRDGFSWAVEYLSMHGYMAGHYSETCPIPFARISTLFEQVGHWDDYDDLTKYVLDGHLTMKDSSQGFIATLHFWDLKN